MELVKDKVNEISGIIEAVCKLGSFTQGDLIGIVNGLENITVALSSNGDFVSEIDEFNGYLEELLGAIENNDINLVKDIYEFKIKDLVLSY